MCREIPNIVGWKMTYTYQGTRPIVKALRSLDHHVSILAARGSVFHEYLANGYFDGALTGSFNYAMEQTVDHIGAWKRRDLTEASKIWDSGLSELDAFVYEPRYSLRQLEIQTWLLATGIDSAAFYETSSATAEKGRGSKAEATND